MGGVFGNYQNGTFGQTNGLYSASRGNQYFPAGSYGYWSFTAPGTTSIVQAEWTHLSHIAVFAGGPAPCIDYGLTYNYSAWRVHGVECANFTPDYRLSCWDCSDSDGFSYDPTVTGALVGTGVYSATIANFSDYLGQSTMYLADPEDPTLTLTSQPPAGWTDTPTGTIAATATDPGLGVASITIDGAGTTNNTGCLTYGPCPNSMSRSTPVTALPEGANPINVTARDASAYAYRDANGNIIAAQHQATQTVTVKVDHQAPTITPSGSLYDARNAFVGPNQDYALNVTATDGSLSSLAAQRSGATSLSATLDGQPMLNASASAPCSRPEGSCSLSINTTLTATDIQQLDDTATHTIAITATDALGHTASPTTFTFRIDSIAPSSFSDGDLSQLSGRTLAEDSYRLRVEARDNQPFQAEMDDNSDDTPPIFNQPGAGLKDLVIRLDGQTVATTATTCFDDPACEDARVWQWDTTTAANGTHTITVTAADKVGNQDVDSFQIDLQRAADQQPRTDSTLRRTVLGAGAGDRTGAAVAALGDVNGDGFADYAVGSPSASPSGRVAAGSASLVLGSADTSTIDLSNPGTAARTISGPGNSQYCGTSVAAAGDVNGDGLADMLVGCPGIDSRLGAVTTTGRVYVIFGSTGPQNVDLATIGTAGFVITGPIDTYAVGVPIGLESRSAVFGERLQSSPLDQTSKDVNDDGLDDIVIGDSTIAQGSNGYAGAVYVIYGKTDNQTVDATALGTAGYVIRGAVANSLTGYSAVIAGDLNGDTFADILIGAPGHAATTGARAYIVNGAPYDANGARSSTDVDLGAPAGRAVTLTSGDATDRFGVTVAALGDTNLDDTPDVAIGTSSGAYVLRTIPTTSRQVTVNDGYRITGPTNQPNALSTQIPAAPISAAGDLNGDERADIIIGYPDTTGARAYTVRSPEGARTINVASLPGQRGAAITTGTQSDAAGAAVAANSYQGTTPVSENAQAIIGAPNADADSTRPAAGRAYVLSEPTPAGPGVDPLQPPTTQASVAITRAAAATATAAAAPSGASPSLFDPAKTQLPGLFHIFVNDAFNTRWATVRNDLQLLVIGSAADLQPLYADDQQYTRDKGSGGKHKNYVHGRLEGDINRCGWVIGDKVVGDNPDDPNQGTAFPSSGSPKPPCAKKRRLAPRAFASLINCDACNDGSPTRLRRRDGGPLPARIPIYRNVRPGAHEGKYSPDGTIPTEIDGQVVSVNWRYITKSGGFVMVRSSSRNVDIFGNRIDIFGHNKWAFIERKYLPHTAGNGGLCDNTEGGPQRSELAGPGDDPGSEFLNYTSEPAVDSSRRHQRDDWPRVCSHRKYNVPDHDGPL